MFGFLSSLKTRFWDPRSVRVKSLIKLGLVILAWWIFEEWGTGLAPFINWMMLSVGLLFTIRLAEAGKKKAFWVVFAITTFLVNFNSVRGIIPFLFYSTPLSNMLFMVPMLFFIKRAIRGR